MANDITKTLFSYAGWYFLPNFVTSLLQTTYYKITYPVGRRHPQPGEPRFNLHRRRIYILVITSYLIYTTVQTLYDIRLAGDFYQDLGLSPTATVSQIKSRFRRLAARYHPDKIQSAINPAPSTEAEAHFVRLKLAQDTLLDPAQKFAYERFGPNIVRHQQNLKTIRDYVYAGLKSLTPEYIAGAIGLVAVNVFWLRQWGRFWRYYSFMTLVTLELYFLTHTYSSSKDSFFLGRYSKVLCFVPDNGILPERLLPFQFMTLARRFSLSLNYFISQLSPPTQAGSTGGQTDPEIQERMNRLAQIARMPDSEASSLLNLSTAPFKGDRESVEALRREMLEGLVTNAIRARPEVRHAVQHAMERRARTLS